jgi:hypothetical protein
MSRALDLPEPLYHALLDAAHASGLTPADWIASKLPASNRSPTPEEGTRATTRLLSHSVSLGHPTGLANEEIDADIARELGASHEDPGTAS